MDIGSPIKQIYLFVVVVENVEHTVCCHINHNYIKVIKRSVTLVTFFFSNNQIRLKRRPRIYTETASKTELRKRHLWYTKCGPKVVRPKPGIITQAMTTQLGYFAVSASTRNNNNTLTYHISYVYITRDTSQVNVEDSVSNNCIHVPTFKNLSLNFTFDEQLRSSRNKSLCYRCLCLHP